LVSFLFAVLLFTVPPCPAICKSGEARAPVPYGVGATAHNYYNYRVLVLFLSPPCKTINQSIKLVYSAPKS